VVAVLTASLFATMMAKLYWEQVLDPHKPVQTAGNLHTGTVPLPAPRGQIVDASGTPLVNNTSVQTITVDRQTLMMQPDQGRSVFTRLGALLGITPEALQHEITPCSPSVAAPCWTGQPYQPVPVSTNASTQAVLTVREHSEQFPGVAVQTVTQASYPYGSLASHVLGYTSQVTENDKKTDPSLADADQIGVSGLEAEYDSVLRGSDGTQDVMLNPRGYAVQQGNTTQPLQGDTLVTTPDASSRSRATRPMTRSSSSAESRTPTTRSSPIRVRTPRCSAAPSPASTHPARPSSSSPHPRW
jgi:penicillin-binding protein 2